MRKFSLIAALGWTLTILISCLTSAKNISSLHFSFLGYDKVIHVSIYFVLVILWLFYFTTKQVPTKKMYIRVALAAVTYGIIIEILQGAVTNDRSADFLDVIANAIGISIATTVFYWYKRPKTI